MTWTVLAGTPDALSGPPTIDLPAGWAPDDVLLLIRGSRGDDAIPTVSGWIKPDSLPVYVGSSAGCGLSVLYKVAEEGETSVAIGDAGNHNAGVILAIRGADVTDVINAIGTPVASSESTSLSVGGLTTDAADCLVLTVGYIQDDTSISSAANSDLSSVTEEVDWSHTFGNDGTLYAISGEKEIAGAVGNTTATIADSRRFTGITIAFNPSDGGGSGGRQDIAFFSGGETGAIDYDGATFAEDSWLSDQVFGADGSSSVANGTETVYVEDSPTRSGGKSIRVRLNESDGLTNDGRRRNELRSPGARNLLYGEDDWWSVSVFIPDNTNAQNHIQSTLVNQSIFQHHWAGASGSNHMHITSGKFKLKWEGVYDHVITSRNVTLGVWHDFVYRIKLHATNGILQIWHQDNLGGYVLIADHTGYTIDAGVDLNPKLGIYRGAFEPGYDHIEIYYDDNRQSKPNLGSFSDVAPGTTTGTEDRFGSAVLSLADASLSSEGNVAVEASADISLEDTSLVAFAGDPITASLNITLGDTAVDAYASDGVFVAKINDVEIKEQSGSSVSLIKSKGTSTASVDDVEADLTWGSPPISDSSVSISGADITINESGNYVFDVTARTVNDNRTELIIRTYIDSDGVSGYTQDTDEIVSDYVSRDTDQDTGSVTLSTAIYLAAGAKIKFAAFGDTDGASSLTTAGTLLRIMKF